MSDWEELKDETSEDVDVPGSAFEDSMIDSSDEGESVSEDEGNSNFKDRHDGPDTGGSGSASGFGNGHGSEGQGPTGPWPGYENQNMGGNSDRGSYPYKGQGYFDGGNQMRSREQHGLTPGFDISMNLSLVSQKRGIGNFGKARGLSTKIKPYWSMGDLSILSLRVLGAGATATVDEVKVQGAKATMARKILRYQHLSERKSINQETYIMHRLKHSHIVRLISILPDTNNITLLMKPVADYTLSHYLRTHMSADQLVSPTWKWFGCLLSGLQHIHSQDIVHGDIKPDNILISKGHVFYADFGLSTIESDDSSMRFNDGFMTKQYAAPEVKKGRRGKPSDVWSLGFVFLEMATTILKQSTADVYTSKCRSPDVSYSNNLDAVTKWIIALQRFGAVQQAPEPVLNVIDSCQTMTLADSKDRPSATLLTQSITLQSCCSAIDSAVRRWDAYSDSKGPPKTDISTHQKVGEVAGGVAYSARLEGLLKLNPTFPIEKACNFVYIQQESMHSIQRTTPYPQGKQMTMLKVWLFCLERHEVLTTGHSDTFQEQYTILVQKYLQILLEQIGSQFTITSRGIGSPYAAILDDLDMWNDSTYAADHQSDGDWTENQSCSNHSGSFGDIDPGGTELHLYSPAHGRWLDVSCELDSGTRGDWVSEDLVHKLGIQAEVLANKSVYQGSQGQEIRPYRTVLLRWHFSLSTQPRENWFQVMEGSFEIILGSEFLTTHGEFIFDKTTPWTLLDNSEGTIPISRMCLWSSNISFSRERADA